MDNIDKMNKPWMIHMFGGLRIVSTDRTISRFRTQKTAALVAYLAYYRERSHPREALIELFWPDSEPESGRHSLSLALSSLRHQLEPPGVPDGAVIVADRFSVELNPDAFTTDVQVFENALRLAAQARNAPNRGDLLAEAIDQYGGVLLPGFYDDWIAPEQERLAQRFMLATEQRISSLEKEGRKEQALEVAQRAVNLVPLYEEGRRRLIRLLAAMGQLDAALRQYRELVRLLDEELGESPQSATTDLARQIEDRIAAVEPLITDASGHADAGPARQRPTAAVPGLLPMGTVSFLMTDIEGSTGLWERAGDAFRSALSIHHALLRREFRRFGGVEVKEAGDSFLAAFSTASDALDCAVACQKSIAAQEWPGTPAANIEGESLNICVRMAIHTGDVELDDGEYHGLMLHRGSRMLSAAHGGQVICSDATSALLRRDLEPEIRLRDLGIFRLRDVEAPERLFQVDYPGMPTRDFPPLRAEAALVARIPLQYTRFFGREPELKRLCEIMEPGKDPTRLVTLTGPGGTGKTRLAIEAAGRLIEAFNGAVWFVSFSDVEDPRLFTDRIAAVMGVPHSANAGLFERVVDALAGQPSLLVLDNLEQLVIDTGAADGADVVEGVQTLLERVPDLSILSTSRALLGLPGEQEFVVPPLRTPGGADNPEALGVYESVRLFVDRAQAVKPDFRVTNHNAPAVAELCDRLEGLPLAIELAAARAQVLTPAQMLAQLANRFEFLVSRKRGVAERQRTLRAAVDWSYRLLAPDLQRFFARLSVFRGGWSVEAAEAVCDEPLALDLLAQLRECSLVITEEAAAGMRFRLLEMLREYAFERLTAEETEEVRSRHRAFYLALAERAEAELTGPDQAQWLDRLEEELDNLRAALQVDGLGLMVDGSEDRPSSINHQLSSALLLARALSRFWSIRGHSREGRRALEALLALAPADHPEFGKSHIRAAALSAVGSMAHDCGDFGPAKIWLDEGIALWREIADGRRLAEALNLAGNVALDSSDPSGAAVLYDEALALFRGAGDLRGISMVLSNLAVVALERKGFPEAARLMDESLHLKRQIGNRHGLATAMENLGNIRMRLGEHEAARDLHAEALSIRREIGHKAGIAMSLNNMGHVLLALGDLKAATVNLSESIGLFHELGDSRGLSEALEGAAGVLFARGTHEQGANLLGAAQGILGAPSEASDSGGDDQAQRLAVEARKALGDKKFEKALALGRGWTHEEAVERANNSLKAEPA